VTTDARIGECDACHARFKVPASFRADRARCRECGGVVILERTQPVPRPPLEKSRKPKSVERPARDEQQTDELSAASAARLDERGPRRASNPAPAAGAAVAQSSAPSPAKAPLEKQPAKLPVEKQTPEKDRAASTKESKKPAGVIGSIVAAAKAAMWRKKRDDARSAD
jgi:hypothetical protein